MKKEPNPPIVPSKVRIIKCGRRSWWYANLIGEEFNVMLGENTTDHIVWEDYWSRGNVRRHIAQEDCEIIEEVII